MDILSALSRAKRGLRDDLRMHLLAIASLTVAFLCLGAALLSVTNLSRIAERWGGSQHLTVYLKDRAAPGDLAQLRLVLESLQEAKEVRHVTAEQARRDFAAQANMTLQTGTLDPEAFPASLEVALREQVTTQRIAVIADRVRHFSAVDEVETYHDWFAQMATLLRAGKSAVALFAMLVVVCVLAIIGNGIRLAVANRRREIEVLKLCGATDAFVRSPFVVEGTLQAVTAATIALFMLLLTYAGLRGEIASTLSAITGVQPVFLHPLVVLGMIVGGGVVGALGSTLSLRRYLKV